MSYDTTVYKQIIARSVFEDTTDWLPKEHVPEWMRFTDRLKIAPGYTTRLSTPEAAKILGISEKRMRNLVYKYKWAYKQILSSGSCIYKFSQEHIEKYKEILK